MDIFRLTALILGIVIVVGTILYALYEVGII
jgi:hypothetical protein